VAGEDEVLNDDDVILVVALKALTCGKEREREGGEKGVEGERRENRENLPQKDNPVFFKKKKRKRL